MVEAKRALFWPGKGLPVAAGGFQQAVGADDIGLDKIRRAVNRTVDVGFGGQMHDRLRLEAREHCADGGLVDDIGLYELIAAIGRDTGQRFQIAGVGEFVQVEHFVLGVLNQMTYQSRTDKTGATGNENAHDWGPFP